MENKLKNVEAEIDITQFLDSILHKSTVLSSRIDDQLNILLGLGTVVFIFAASKIQSTNDSWWIILACGAGLSAIIGLFAVHPPRFITKMGQSESLLYNKNISRKFKTSKEYGDELLKVSNNKEAIVYQYAVEVYNVYTYYYGPKRKLFKLARLVLVAGIIFASLTFLLGVWAPSTI